MVIMARLSGLTACATEAFADCLSILREKKASARGEHCVGSHTLESRPPNSRPEGMSAGMEGKTWLAETTSESTACSNAIPEFLSLFRNRKPDGGLFVRAVCLCMYPPTVRRSIYLSIYLLSNYLSTSQLMMQASCFLMYLSACWRICLCMFACVYVYIYIYIYTDINMCIYMCIYIYFLFIYVFI